MPSESGFAEDVHENFVDGYCVVAGTTLLIFEYVITFDREYHLVWKRKPTAATLFFLLARYIMFPSLILEISTTGPLPNESCDVLSWLIVVFEKLPSIIWAGFSSLRIYALSGRQWVLALLVFVLQLVPFGIDVLDLARIKPLNTPPPLNCIVISSIPQDLNNILTPLAISAVIAADALVLVVTVLQTYRTRKMTYEANLPPSFSALILRDGSLYFLTLLIIDAVNIALTVTQDFTLTSQFTDPITAILISRFILNLREIDSLENGGVDSSRPSFVRSHEVSVRFATFVQPLGAPLDHDFSFSERESSSSGDELDGEGTELGYLSGGAGVSSDKDQESTIVISGSDASSSHARGGHSALRGESCDT